jgi:integrase/recombinase XerD
MFYQLYNRQSTAEDHLASPLSNERLRYLEHCSEQGYTRGTLRVTAQSMRVIIDELNLQDEGEVSLDEISVAANRWASRESQCSAFKHGLKARRQFIWVAVQWLRFLGRLRVPEHPPDPDACLVAEFADYLHQEKGLASETIRNQCWHATQFLNRFCGIHRSLQEISIAHINEALARKGSEDGSTRRTIRSVAEGLRSFFRFAEMKGLCSSGLSLSIKAPRIYQDESLPSGPSWDDVRRLLASTEGENPIDIRDRAILLLLSCYGLRSGEVRGLKLNEIDWEHETLVIGRSKQQRRNQMYPLVQSVGDAILCYLQKVRPRSSYREVFLTVQAPIKPLSGTGLWHIVGIRLRKLGISPKHQGPHVLRHSCATHLLAEGVSMKAIADHLGHQSLKATSIYAKVDLNGLRQVADFDLGGLL